MTCLPGGVLYCALTLVYPPPCPPPQVLRLLIKAYEGVASPDWPEVCQCLMVLDDHEEVANILDRLLRGSQVRLPSLLLRFRCVVLPSPSCATFLPLQDRLSMQAACFSLLDTCCLLLPCSAVFSCPALVVATAHAVAMVPYSYGLLRRPRRTTACWPSRSASTWWRTSCRASWPACRRVGPAICTASVASFFKSCAVCSKLCHLCLVIVSLLPHYCVTDSSGIVVSSSTHHQ